MLLKIPNTEKKRIVIIGGGFAGLTLANKLDKRLFQVVLIDKNNYHQFQPLLYQVASSGLEVSSITFPFRKIFRKYPNFYFRLTDLKSINSQDNTIETSLGSLGYDYLVLATGTTTNFYGNESIEKHAIPMKSIEEALLLRNSLLINLENAVNTDDLRKKEALLNIAIVGGGATGVEIAGALAEMKRYIIPRDYPDLKSTLLNIFLLEGTDKLLSNMSEKSSKSAEKTLKEMGVEVLLNKKVTDYKDNIVTFENGETLRTGTLIWVSGVISEKIAGIDQGVLNRGNRIQVDEYNLIKGTKNIYALGDLCMLQEEKYPNGHPQVAPVAIQQGKLLAKNLKALEEKKELKAFHYKNQGTLATIGRNKAVADLKNVHLNGFPAWAVWSFVHLRSILGVRNKIMVLIDWVWNYFTYDRFSRYIMFIYRRKK